MHAYLTYLSTSGNSELKVEIPKRNQDVAPKMGPPKGKGHKNESKMKPLTGPRYTLKCAGLHQARKIESLILDQMPSAPTNTSLLSALPKQNSHSDNGLNGHRKKVPIGHLSICHFVFLPHLLSVGVHHFFPAIKWSNHGQAMYSQTFGQTYHNM